MQNDFCAPGGYVETGAGLDATPCRAVVQPIAELLDQARAAGVPVIWVRADYGFDKVPPAMRAKALERGSTAMFACGGTWGAAFYGVAPAPGERVFDKTSYSAFMGTRLDRHLRGLGIRTLVFCGVQTNVCVDTSVRDAASLGFYVAVAADCVASHTPALHDASLKTLGFLFGDVLPKAEIVRHWQATR
jgi:ureidoacrylate peracid hydrolase